jgi:osmotically-inducible protein OsmY
MLTMRSDAELQRDVLNELTRDERLHIEDLDVKVEGRVVTVSGRAETPCQRWRALQLARYVAGIAPVSDRIVIDGH